MKGILKDTFILFVITLVAGFCLGAAHEVTLEPIAKAQAAAATATYQEVYPEAVAFEEPEALKSAVEAATAQIGAQGFGNVTIDDAQNALAADGSVIGHLITVSSNDGYNGLIQVAVGIGGDGKLTGIGLLSISETPGLGMKATEPEFLDQFVGKPVSGSYTLTKSGTASDTEIQALSGATYTSTAITGAVNAAVWFVQNCVTE